MNKVRANYTFTDWDGLEIECILLANEYTERGKPPEYTDIECCVESVKQFGKLIHTFQSWKIDAAWMIENELNANDHDGIKWEQSNE